MQSKGTEICPNPIKAPKYRLHKRTPNLPLHNDSFLYSCNGNLTAGCADLFLYFHDNGCPRVTPLRMRLSIIARARAHWSAVGGIKIQGLVNLSLARGDAAR